MLRDLFFSFFFFSIFSSFLFFSTLLLLPIRCVILSVASKRVKKYIKFNISYQIVTCFLSMSLSPLRGRENINIKLCFFFLINGLGLLERTWTSYFMQYSPLGVVSLMNRFKLLSKRVMALDELEKMMTYG